MFPAHPKLKLTLAIIFLIESLWALCACVVHGGELAIISPESVQPGELVVVEGDAEPGMSAAIAWDIQAPIDLHYRIFDNARFLVFAAPQSPQTVIGNAWVIDWEKKTFERRAFRIVVVGKPTPNPNPNPSPDKFGMAELAKKSFTLVPAEGRILRDAVIIVYDVMAADIRAGKFTTATSATDAARVRMRNSLKDGVREWEHFGAAIAKRLEENEAAISTDIQLLASAYAAIADGLRTTEHANNSSHSTQLLLPPTQRPGGPQATLQAPATRWVR